MLRVGLTGGIACGKTHVRRRLAERGLATVDLDEVAHAVMAPGGAAHADVVAAFGSRVVAGDGTIDRGVLGTIVFEDPVARARLDALVHPRVREEEARRARLLEGEGEGVLVSDAALLVEAGAHLRFDRLVVVHCPPLEQRRRLMERDGLTEAAAQARISAQMPVEVKRRFAHVEVDTSGTVEETNRASDAVADSLRALAARPRPGEPVGERRLLGALAGGAGPGPRGLEAALLLAAALESGGVELGVLARRLVPPAEGPWYRAAAPGEQEPFPEALSVALACWSGRIGGDPDWLVSAAASLARLTHDAPSDVAGACLAALVARDVGVRGTVEDALPRTAGWEPLARRWGGATPPARVALAVEAAQGHPDDVAAARGEAARRGAEPAFAGALVGLVRGVPAGDASPRLLALARRLAG